jgi:hypothetical protein
MPVVMQYFGGIAQLGERLHGMQEVIGSIPFTSTKNSLEVIAPVQVPIV